MSRRSRIALAMVGALLVVPMIAGPSSAARGASGPSAVSAAAEHARIVRYWTPARMKAAVPRDFDATGQVKAAGRKPAGQPAVSGTSWPNGGDVLQLTGKVWFNMSGSGWICSGSIINDARAGYSVVLTAGHCAVDNATGEFATNWLFIPNFDAAPVYDCAAVQYGCWTAISLSAHYGFVHAGSFNSQATTHDWAFATVGPGGKGGTIPSQLDARGSYPIRFSSSVSGRVQPFGYPAAGKYNGADLTWCAGNVFSDFYNLNRTWGVACDMTGGSSGGPWFQGLDESNGSGGTVSSLNSYTRGGLNNMYGPKFNS